MSGNGGAWMARGTGSGLQPLKATVPFQLQRKAQERWQKSTPGVRHKLQQRPQTPTRIRRTLSLDAIVGTYLQGYWPREGEEHGGPSPKDTQISYLSYSESQKKEGGRMHKRSASLGSAQHLREIATVKHQMQPRWKAAGQEASRERAQSQPLAIPLVRSPAFLGCSEERLEQELERAFRRQSALPHARPLEVPDGHRAPAPPLSCSSHSDASSSVRLLSSPSSSLSPSPSPLDLDSDMPDGIALLHMSPLTSAGESDPSPLLLSISPRPNKSYSFQREPPEGCERVRVCEESLSPCVDQYLSSCPDPDKVHFMVHGGSAFCPVSLLEPLMPSVDILFRSLTVSTSACWVGPATAGLPSNPGTAAAGYLTPPADSTYKTM